MGNHQLRGLFLNTQKAVCSIYESGRMCYDALSLSSAYQLDYQEISSDRHEIGADYDFYVFNYHWVTMGWLDTAAVRDIPGFKATIVLEVSPNDPFSCVSKDDFDGYIVLDPTCRHEQRNVYAFSRPLEKVRLAAEGPGINNVPVIGTFGLSFGDKGFDEVIEAVSQEFDEAIVKINVPHSEHVSDVQFDDYKSYLLSLTDKPGIKVEMTRHYFDQDQLVDWCAQNTLNVFLYNRRIGNGLSATTDQAIASGRPLAVSTNPTFRHIHAYIAPYPYRTLKDSIEFSAPAVKLIQDEWQPLHFANRFNQMLKENDVVSVRQGARIVLREKSASRRTVLGRLSNLTLLDFVPPIFVKIGRRFTRDFPPNTASIERSPFFAHLALSSFSGRQEDLLLDCLLNGRRKGFYITVGANAPFSLDSTERFYRKGWRGLNIESNVARFDRITIERPADKNLNVEFAAHVSPENQPPRASETWSLAKLLSTHIPQHIKVDLMVITMPGEALSLLKSNNWQRHRPTLIMLKARMDDHSVIQYLDRNKYMYLFGNLENLIFVDKMSNDPSIVENMFWGG